MVGLTALVGTTIADQLATTEGAVGPGLEDVARDRGVTHLNDVGVQALRVEVLVRSVETLLLKLADACTSCEPILGAAPVRRDGAHQMISRAPSS